MDRRYKLPRLPEHGIEDCILLGQRSEILEQCFALDGKDLGSLFRRGYELSRKNFGNLIHFYIPGMVRYETSFYKRSGPTRFPGVSVTGTMCHLKCEHCNGQLLKSMIPATTPQALVEVCNRIKKEGGGGCLISGGSLNNGSVPLTEFIPAIKRLKQDLELQVVVHTGLVDSSLAEALAESRIDAAMIDIIGSNDTIKEVYHLESDISSFDHSLSFLEENNIPTIPHIVVGIHYGKLKGEKRALEILSKHHPAAVVVVALTPLENTRMEHVEPPRPLDIGRVVLASRLLMPNTPLLLGCARPRGQHKVETDDLSIRAGVNGIAYPSEEAYSLADDLRLQVRLHEKCCSLIWSDFPKSVL